MFKIIFFSIFSCVALAQHPEIFTSKSFDVVVLTKKGISDSWLQEISRFCQGITQKNFYSSVFGNSCDKASIKSILEWSFNGKMKELYLIYKQNSLFGVMKTQVLDAHKALLSGTMLSIITEITEYDELYEALCSHIQQRIRTSPAWYTISQIGFLKEMLLILKNMDPAIFETWVEDNGEKVFAFAELKALVLQPLYYLTAEEIVQWLNAPRSIFIETYDAKKKTFSMGFSAVLMATIAPVALYKVYKFFFHKQLTLGQKIKNAIQRTNREKPRSTEKKDQTPEISDGSGGFVMRGAPVQLSDEALVQEIMRTDIEPLLQEIESRNVPMLRLEEARPFLSRLETALSIVRELNDNLATKYSNEINNFMGAIENNQKTTRLYTKKPS